MRRIDAFHGKQAVEECVSVLNKGGIAAFPTETFYGLGVRYDNETGLRKLYGIKRRPAGKALPLIIGAADLLPLVALPPDPMAERLIERFWPGPLTLLLPAQKSLSPLITAGTGRVAVRIPGPSLALDIALSLRVPLTATSANISGMKPAATPSEVLEYFGDAIDLLLEAGRSPGGRPSTIVEVKEGEVAVLREGVITSEELSAARPTDRSI